MMQPTWRISAATREDAFALAALKLQMDRGFGLTPYPGFLDEYADHFLAHFEDLPTWIAKTSHGDPVGAVQCALIHRLPNLKRPATPNFHIGTLFVVPSMRGQGLGEDLMEHALAWARRRGCGRAALNAVEEARGLYERCGFAAPRATWMEQALQPAPEAVTVRG